LDIFLPVLLNTAFYATDLLSSLNCYSISWHLACFSFNFAWSSDAILLYLSWVSFRLKRTWCTLAKVLRYLCSFIETSGYLSYYSNDGSIRIICLYSSSFYFLSDSYSLSSSSIARMSSLFISFWEGKSAISSRDSSF
jgi:hypothetical protein